MAYEPQADFGTPPSASPREVTLTIDGRAVTVPEGTSVMRATSEAGGSIPKLCATDSVKAFGSSRLCLVEVEGMRGTPPPAPRRSQRAWSSTRKPRGSKSCVRG